MKRQHALAILEEIYAECKEDNWDTYEARGVTEGNYQAAVKFINALPPQLLDFEITVEPSGELAFEWYRAPKRVFVASINSELRLSYAGLFDGNDVHGTERLADSLPSTLISNILRLDDLRE